MGAPIVYRWDDAEAPVARGQRDSLVEILTACLVNGYGTKSAAGWTREYVNVDNTIAAFRNNPVTGTGFYMQIDGALPLTANIVNVSGFETMSSEIDGLGPFSTLSQITKMSKTAGTTAHPWVLVADDRAFYLFIWTTKAATAVPSGTIPQWASMFFGDNVSIHSGDEYFCGLNASAAYGGVGALNTPGVLSGGTRNSTWIARKRGGAVGGINRGLISGGGPTGTALFSGGDDNGSYTEGDPIYISRPFFYDNEIYKIRGYHPGLYQPLHKVTNSPFAQLESKVIEGKNYLYMVVYQTSNQNICVLLSLDDWRV